MDEGLTHSECGYVSNCPMCHCHDCHVFSANQRDEAREVARRFLAILKRLAPLSTHDEYLESRYNWLREAKEMGE